MTMRGYERIKTRPRGPARLVLQGQDWRVVAMELPDTHGVLRTEYLIERTDGPEDKDLMGVQRWHELTGQSAQSEWVMLARRFLDELLKHAGEKPDSLDEKLEQVGAVMGDIADVLGARIPDGSALAAAMTKKEER